jgi:hypothetical protein
VFATCRKYPVCLGAGNRKPDLDRGRNHLRACPELRPTWRPTLSPQPEEHGLSARGGLRQAPASITSRLAGLSGRVEAKGLEPSDLLTASQALYQLSYAPGNHQDSSRPAVRSPLCRGPARPGPMVGRATEDVPAAKTVAFPLVDSLSGCRRHTTSRR